MMRLICLWVALLLSLRAQGPPTPFLPAEQCATCHSLLFAPGVESRSIAPYGLWSASMMAHSAVDPIWKAQVRFEGETNPRAKAMVEKKCRSCHAPMGTDEGVSCTVCHKIEATGLGTPASFTAGFRINTKDLIYGPHKDPFTMPMRMHTGMTPSFGRHILESSLCGSCHTVITPILDEQGNAHGEFLEQAPYLEWLASGFPEEGKTCQSCHLPQLGEASYIAHRPPGGPFPPTSPRLPFGLHTLIGGNYLAPALMGETNPGERDMLARTTARALDSLRSALDLSLTAKRTGNHIRVQVGVENRTGHKLPTGFPGRRLWLHLRVTGSSGAVLFESGAPSGPIPDQPHHQVIESADQTIVYEASLLDRNGQPAFSVMRAASYGKDNRILPRGWKSGSESIAPVGTTGDPDFLPGSDLVDYLIPGSTGECKLEVEAYYQAMKPGYAVTGPAALIGSATYTLAAQSP